MCGSLDGHTAITYNIVLSYIYENRKSSPSPPCLRRAENLEDGIITTEFLSATSTQLVIIVLLILNDASRDYHSQFYML